MAKEKNTSKKPKNDGATVGYEAQLWQMADALRGSMDAAEYFIQSSLARVFSDMNDRIAIARDECRTLAALRDALLPKLVSGALRIGDAERFIAKHQPS